MAKQKQQDIEISFTLKNEAVAKFLELSEKYGFDRTYDCFEYIMSYCVNGIFTTGIVNDLLEGEAR